MWNDLKRRCSIGIRHSPLLFEALIALAVAQIAMVFLPFRRIAAWLGTPGLESAPTATDEQIRIAREIGWAVGALGRRVPWDGRCLAQALAATGMLRLRGVEGTVTFGACVGKSAGFHAHAWLRVGSSIVTGAAGHQQFKALATFARKK